MSSSNSDVLPLRRYLLGLVGSKSANGGPGDPFQFNGESYELIFDCKITLLIRDVSRLKEFNLELVSPEEDHLGLYFYPERVELLQSNSEGLSRKRIIQSFFTLSEPVTTLPEDEESPSATREEYEHLYERLRRKHLENPRFLPEPWDAQHKSLRPLLREYQKDGVTFMMHRETVPDSIPAAYDVLQANAIEGQEFYLNCFTGELTDERPEDVPLPSGGILADEMGLGKTVEMLSLILNNPKEERIQAEADDERETRPISGVRISEKSQLKCMCTSSSTKGLIKCNRCLFYQHVSCVQKNRIEKSTETEDNYICPKCWTNEPLVETGATIIVSPYSISRQWQKEIQTHIQDPSFKLMIYSGVSRFGWITPLDLAQYDVVITDYNVLRTEIHYTAVDTKEGCLRREKKHLNPSSPLTSMKWWRVCLDEAQMVETASNQATKMVKTLSTVHRWAVTGTPIEKSINQIFGLLFFLDCTPYNEFGIWARLAQPFLQHQNPDPLIEGVLKSVMWRTCKRHVLDQVRIPPQTIRCHMVAMSDLQTVFYRDQHEQCRMSFLEQASRMKRYGLAASMSKWDAHSIKMLLEPLRKLRQDCTMPSLQGKGDALAKRLLSPDELYSHLLTVNEIECKSKLRAIASNLNGMAGIAMLLQDYPLASRYYRSVLKRAEENNAGSVTVDSLLQIHALHNLIQLIVQQREGVEGADQLEDYKKQLRQLETKYTDNCYQVMKSAENQLESAKPTVDLQSHQQLGHWWRVLIRSQSASSVAEEQLLNRVNFDLRSNNFVNSNATDLMAASGIDYTLTTWWDTVIQYRKRVHKGLKQLNYFTEKIRPGYQATDKENAQIQSLIVAAAECHLILEKEAADAGEGEDKEEECEEPAAKMKRKTPCELCQVKTLLIEYECKIFDKTFNEERQEGEGTWKPSWQEWITKTLQSLLRRGTVEERLLEDAEQFSGLMEALKQEYKELSKCWVEVNYTVAAFDELNMCKLQLTAVDPETLKKGEKMKRHQISVHAIGLTRAELQAELDEVELGFVKSQRNLSYLNHLSSNPEVQTCPICSLKPEDKYSVWECGHQLCIQCLLAMKKYHGVRLNCPVCRHTQLIKDMHYVTVAKQHNIHVEGRYSTKIVRIVQEIQALRNEDLQVKVIIFSQWEANLAVINGALVENKISTRSNKSLTMIEEFKSPSGGITCLLLPLSWGSKGLNLIEATHVFLVEPILNPSEELQAVGRVHRIGQTKPTVVHRFIVENTVEETIYRTVSNDATGKWKCKDISLDNLSELFALNCL